MTVDIVVIQTVTDHHAGLTMTDLGEIVRLTGTGHREGLIMTDQGMTVDIVVIQTGTDHHAGLIMIDLGEIVRLIGTDHRDDSIMTDQGMTAGMVVIQTEIDPHIKVDQSRMDMIVLNQVALGEGMKRPSSDWMTKNEKINFSVEYYITARTMGRLIFFVIMFPLIQENA
jgi:hypothetical protein